jgi:hypothetical protein
MGMSLQSRLALQRDIRFGDFQAVDLQLLGTEIFRFSNGMIQPAPHATDHSLVIVSSKFKRTRATTV